MNNFYLDIAPEVKSALAEGRPVVALESTIISHGMPYPQNVQTAKEVENIIRREGAVPATIAVIGGKMKVGLSAEEIEYLGKKGMSVTKASRRDLPLLAAKGADGATTVAATMIIASMAGIKIFATGGIGGVHRGAETTMDISADLEELGRTDVAVVCSGAKSILDIGLTLEYLETKGVPVVGFGTDELPAFYCRESGFGVDCRIDTPEELAKAIKAKYDLGIHGGILVGNPIPKQYEMPKAMADRAIDFALKKAEENGIKGKQLTPFLLALVKEMTGGMSLDSNIQLVYNNAKVAAQTAVALAVLNAEEASAAEEEESLDMLRAEIADDTAESIARELATFRGEMETMVAQRVAAVQQMQQNAFMNPYMNPYQQMPYGQNPYAAQQGAPNPYQQNPYGQNPYAAQQSAPNPYQQNPYQPMPEQFGQPQYQAPQPTQPYVNPYKPVRPAQPPVQEPVVDPRAAYKSIPDDQWVNPFAPKRDKAPEPVAEPVVEPEAQPEVQPEPIVETSFGGDAPAANVIVRTSEEVMEMVEETVAEFASFEQAQPEEPEEPVVEEAEAETEEEPATEEEYTGPVPSEPTQPNIDDYVSPFDDPMGVGEEDENTLTEYVPPVHEKRKPDNMIKPEMDTEGMTSYDPNFYRKRAEERKQRIAEAAGEAKHRDEDRAAEPEYVDCKGPLEFTGEHPWAWKCTACGQIFQKHELPHKCVKTR